MVDSFGERVIRYRMLTDEGCALTCYHTGRVWERIRGDDRAEHWAVMPGDRISLRVTVKAHELCEGSPSTVIYRAFCLGLII